MNISVKIDGLARLTKIAEKYPEISEKHINFAITRALTRVLGAVKVNAPFGVSGMLRDNWKITTGRFEGTLASLSSYGAYVESGTKPHMPPISALEPWAKKHGINPWALAMSIKKKGTRANPFLQKSVDSSQAGMESDFADALDNTLAEATSLPDT